MKVVTKATEFKPVVIKLTIESQYELNALWHRLEVGPSAIASGIYSGKDRFLNIPADILDDLFDVIDRIKSMTTDED